VSTTLAGWAEIQTGVGFSPSKLPARLLDARHRLGARTIDLFKTSRLFMNRLRLIAYVSVLGTILATSTLAQQSSAPAAPSSEQIKREAQLQKKAAGAKHKWAKAEEKVKKLEQELAKAKQDAEQAHQQADTAQQQRDAARTQSADK
jgi:hypothetical protein